MATWTLTIDCTTPSVVAAFWKIALGYVDSPPPRGFASWEAWFVACAVPEDERDDGATIVDPTGEGPRISLLKVPEAKRTKNRLHIDVQASGGRAVPSSVRAERIREKARQLVDAGATVLDEHRIGGELDHLVLADPEGNELCVV